MKTDLEKLQEQKLDDEDDNSTDEKESESRDQFSIDDTTTNSMIEQPKNYQINDFLDVYHSIKLDRFPTSLVINRKETAAAQEELGEIETDDSSSDVKSVNDFASVLVKSIIEKAVLEVKSKPNTNIYDPNYIRNTYLSNSDIRSRRLKDNSETSILAEFNANKSTSRLSYYKEFQTDVEQILADSKQEVSMKTGDENEDEKFVLEFEDEPAELV